MGGVTRNVLAFVQGRTELRLCDRMQKRKSTKNERRKLAHGQRGRRLTLKSGQTVRYLLGARSVVNTLI